MEPVPVLISFFKLFKILVVEGSGLNLPLLVAGRDSSESSWGMIRHLGFRRTSFYRTSS